MDPQYSFHSLKESSTDILGLYSTDLSLKRCRSIEARGFPWNGFAQIQEALIKPCENRQIKLDYDGSITFVNAYSEITLAQLAAQLFQRSRAQNQSTTLVAKSECSHLDTALRSLDEPVLGLSVRSTQRPALQTLVLALALRWEPLDPRDLLAFLIHPVSPVNDGLQARLARAVAERHRQAWCP